MVTSLITKIPSNVYLAQNEDGYVRVKSDAKVVFSGLGVVVWLDCQILRLGCFIEAYFSQNLG